MTHIGMLLWLACWASTAGLGCHGGHTVGFVLKADEGAPGSGLPRILIVIETRSITGGPDSRWKSRLESASARVGSDKLIRCEVPKLCPPAGVIYVPPLVLVTDLEYRITLFVPGYSTVTIYPEGVYNTSEASGASPALLRAIGSSPGTHHHAQITLTRKKGEDNVFEVPLQKLPLKYINSRDVDTFYAQLYSLSDAMKSGALKLSGKECTLLLEAIAAQYKSFSVSLASQSKDVTSTPVAEFKARLGSFWDYLRAECGKPSRNEKSSRPVD